MARRKRPLEMEEIADLVAEDVGDFLEDFDDSDSSSVSAYTDTDQSLKLRQIAGLMQMNKLKVMMILNVTGKVNQLLKGPFSLYRQ